jgi:surface antigen
MEAIRQSAIGAPRMTGNALVGLGKRDSNMRRILILASLAVAALVATAAIPAEAGHRSRVGVGFHFGFPGPYYYGPAAYYAPPAGQVIREGRDSAGNYCREYQSSTSIDGRPVPTYGTACLRPDGSWQIVN